MSRKGAKTQRSQEKQKIDQSSESGAGVPLTLFLASLRLGAFA
jgi:hypothetical protein